MMEKIRLDELCDINMGQSPDSNSYNQEKDGLPFFQGNADFGELYPTTRMWCNKPLKVVEKDTLLISVRAPIGALNFATEKCCIGRGLAGIKPKEEVNLKYIFYCLKYKKVELNNKGTGSTFKAIAKTALGEIKIKALPKQEQDYHSEVLDKVSNIIAQRKEQLILLDDLIKSRFVEMFGDPVHNPLGWNIKPFLECGSCKNGMNFGTGETGVELQYLGVGDFKNLTKIEEVTKLGQVCLNKMPSEDYMLKNGDIIFVRSNGNKALVGRCLAIYPNGIPTTYSGFCIRYRKTDESLEIPYLLQVLKTESMRLMMAGRGANIQNLNQQILGQLQIPIPPNNLQREFGQFIEQVDKLKVAY